MRRHITLLAALALAVSMGCAKGAAPAGGGYGGAHARVGAVSPGQFHTIPAGYDPSVTGYPGAVGDIIQNAGSLSAWVRSGANNTDWQAFPVPSSFAGALTFNGVSTFNAEVSIPGVADFQTTGTTLTAPVTMTTPGSSVAQVFSTGTINLTTTGFFAFNTPLVAGKRLIRLSGFLEVITRDATLTSGLTIALAQNGVDIVGAALSPTAALLNALASPQDIFINFSNVTSPSMTTNPLQLHISAAVAGSGLTTCTGAFYLIGVYI